MILSNKSLEHRLARSTLRRFSFRLSSNMKNSNFFSARQYGFGPETSSCLKTKSSMMFLTKLLVRSSDAERLCSSFESDIFSNLRKINSFNFIFIKYQKITELEICENNKQTKGFDLLYVFFTIVPGKED